MNKKLILWTFVFLISLIYFVQESDAQTCIYCQADGDTTLTFKTDADESFRGATDGCRKADNTYQHYVCNLASPNCYDVISQNGCPEEGAAPPTNLPGCLNGKTQCNGDTIQTCVNGNWQNGEECYLACEVSGGNAQCASENQPDPDTSTQNNQPITEPTAVGVCCLDNRGKCSAGAQSNVCVSSGGTILGA